MPTTHAAAKSLRQAGRRSQRNTQVKARLEYLVKQARRLAIQGPADQARAAVNEAVKAFDRAVRSGIIKANTASRMKSRLFKRLRLAKPNPSAKS